MIINNKILLAIIICQTIAIIVTIIFIIRCGPYCKYKKYGDDDGCGGKCNNNPHNPPNLLNPTIPPTTPNTPAPPNTPNPPRDDLKDQDSSTMKIINNTSENYLHVFFEVVTDKNGDKGIWSKHNGDGKLYNAVDWAKSKKNVGHSWDPLGAKLTQEGIIPKGKELTVKIPDTNGTAFVVQAIKMTDSNSSTPLVWEDGANRQEGTIKKVVNQWPVLIEGGKDMVADASAVDGINFKLNYSLTTDNGDDNMIINKNPCKGLNDKYKLDIGCRNPAKVDCSKLTDNEWNPKDTCSCKAGTQNCAFNDCSKLLFIIPDNRQQYYHNYDGGKSGKNGEVVKRFINESDNLKNNSLKQFCENIQYDSGDFTTYCYDYNDISSSPTLRSPFKMRVIYTDLD